MDRVVRRFARHRRVVTAVGFVQDGRWAISGSHDRTVRWWEVETGRQLGICRGGGKVQSMAVTPDGRQVLTATLDQGVWLWELPQR